MTRRQFLFVLVMLLGVILLAACGFESTPVPTTPIPATVVPLADVIFVPGCTLSDLETWVEASDYLLRDFVGLVNQISNMPPEEVAAVAQDLIPVRNALVSIPAPLDCATAAHNAILTLVDDTLEAVEQYSSGEIRNLVEFNAAFDVTLGEIQLLHLELEDRLQTMYGNEASGGN